MGRRARRTPARGILLPAILASFASAQRIQPLDGKNTSTKYVYNWGELLHYVHAGPVTPPGWNHPLQYFNPADPYNGFANPSPVVDLTLAKTFSMDGWRSDNGSAYVSNFLLLIRAENQNQMMDPSTAKDFTTFTDTTDMGPLFTVSQGGQLQLHNFQIKNAGCDPSACSSKTAPVKAGAITVESGGWLQVESMTFTSCRGQEGSAIAADGGTSRTVVHINHCDFYSNYVNTGGGAVTVTNGAQVIVRDPKFSAGAAGSDTTGIAIMGTDANITFLNENGKGVACNFLPAAQTITNNAEVYNCQTTANCCKNLKPVLTTGEKIQQFFTKNVAVVATLSSLLFVAIVVIVYYRRQAKKARHHSDLSFKDLREPLIPDEEGGSGSGGGLRTMSTVEMVKSLWKRDSDRDERGGFEDAWQIKFDQLTFNKRIGTGAYGTVYNGTYGDTKLPVAIKKIALSADPEQYRDEIMQAQTEMRILWELRHPNILTFFGVAFVRKDGEELMCMVTELCKGSMDVYIGSSKKLKDSIKKGMPELTNELLMSLLKDAAAGLAFMHSKNLIHRDLKPHNILVAEETGKTTAKIADFGLSRALKNRGGANALQAQLTYTANVGSPAYMAPELLSVDTDNASYAASADMYSFGIIINAMWRRCKPYDEADFNGVIQLLQAVREGHRPTIPDNCPPLLSDLMERCWKAVPEERITAQQLMNALVEHERSRAVLGTRGMLDASTSGALSENPQERSSNLSADGSDETR